MIAQFLGLATVSLRDWIRPAYKKNADTVARQIVLLSILIFLIGMCGLLFRHVIERLHEMSFPVRMLVLLLLLYPFYRYFFAGDLPERGAAAARERWPRLATHALAVSIAFCLACFLPLVILLLSE